MKYIITIILAFVCFTPAYADKVRVQVLTGGDAIYLPMDKYCTPEQVTAILAIVNTSPKAIENEKERRIVEQRVAQELADSQPVKEVTEADLVAEKQALEAQVSELTAQIESTDVRINMYKNIKLDSNTTVTFDKELNP